MRTFIALLVLFTCQILADPNWPPQIIDDFLKESRETCQVQLNLSDDELHRFIKGADFPRPEHVCFFKCMGEINGFIVNNKANPTKFLQLLDQCSYEEQNIILQMGRKCMSMKQRDMCERTYAAHVCFRSADPIHYFV